MRSNRSSSTGRGAGLDQQQPQGRALALQLLVVAQRVHREGGQAQHGLAGGRLEGADDQQLATPSIGARPAARELLVDAGQRLAEPQGASLKVEVVLFQAAQLAGAGAGCRRQDHEGVQPRPPFMVGGGEQDADLLGGEGRRRVGGGFGIGGWVGRKVVPFHGVAERLVQAQV